MGAGSSTVEERAALLDALGQAVIATDAAGCVTYWNAAAEQLYGWTAREALGRAIEELTVPEYDAALGAEIMERIAQGQSWTGGFTVRRKDGSTFTAVVTDTGVRDDTGALVGVVGVSVNIGQVLQPLLAHSYEAAVVTSGEGTVRFASPAVERVLGWSDLDLAGRSLHDLVHPDDRAGVAAWAAGAGKEGTEPVAVEFRLRSRRGTWRWVEGLLDDLRGDPSVRGLVWTLRDTSERRAALEQMTVAALHDPLTGLPNRLLLTDRLAHATARRAPHGAVLFLDLDRFKEVNDRFGHGAGDALLQVVAERLRRTVRPEDSCGRWSGDEFLVLTEAVATRTEALALAGRVEHALTEPTVVDGHRLAPSVSVGVAVLEGAQGPEDVLRAADADMYRVKREHRRAAAGA